MSKLEIVLDATMFDTFQVCPAKYNYRFNHNKVPTTKAKPLDRGTLIHAGQEEYYRELQKQTPFNDRVHAAVLAIRKSALESELSDEEIERVVEVTREVLIVHRNEDETFEVLAVETPFSYVLFEDDHIRITMIGKIDLLVNKPRYNKPVPIDHKSYDRDFPVKRLNNQFTNYSVATDSDYLFVNRIGFQTSIKPEIKHKRVPLSYDDLYKEEWKKNVVRVVYHYVECYAEAQWPMNLTSCDKYNRLCEYYEICDSSGIESKIFKLNANFNTAEKWDVSAVLGKKK